MNVPAPSNDIARGIRVGVLRVLGRELGSDPDRISTFEASAFAMEHLILPALLLLLIIRSISKRQILLLRIAATILLFAGLGSIRGLVGLLAIIVGVLAWLPPVTRYLKSG
jgi:hypothetical protein